MSVNTRLSPYAHRGHTTTNTSQDMLVPSIYPDRNSSYTSHHTWSPRQEPFPYTVGKLIKNTTVVKAFRYLLGGINNLTSTLAAGSADSTHHHNVNLQKRPTQFPTPQSPFRVPTQSPTTNQPTPSPSQPPSGTNTPSMSPATIPSASPITTNPTTPQPVTTLTEQPNTPSPHTQNPITSSPSHQGETNTPSMNLSNTPSTSPTNSSSMDQQGGNHGEGSSALIAAIVGGTVGGAAVLATILYCLYKRSHRYSRVSSHSNGGENLLSEIGEEGEEVKLGKLGAAGDNIQTPTAANRTADNERKKQKKVTNEPPMGGGYQPVSEPLDEQPSVEDVEDLKGTWTAATSPPRNDDGKGGSKRDSSVTQATPFLTLRKHQIEINPTENKGPDDLKKTENQDSQRLSVVPAAGTPRNRDAALLTRTNVTDISENPFRLPNEMPPLEATNTNVTVNTQDIPDKPPQLVPHPSSLFGRRSGTRSSIARSTGAGDNVNASRVSLRFPDGPTPKAFDKQSQDADDQIGVSFRPSMATVDSETRAQNLLRHLAANFPRGSNTDDKVGEENAEGKTPSNMSPSK